MPYFPPTASGSGYSTIEEDGTPQTQRTTINFTGAGATASDSGGKTVVNIPGAAGGSATTVEVNLGATATWRGRFTITDGSISGTSKLLVWQAPGPYTGKGTRADELEMQPVKVIAVVPGTGSAVVHWETPPLLAMNRNPKTGSQPASAIIPGLKDSQAASATIATRLGKVRGNVKFHYMVI